jgi:hypothetical protein
VTIDAYAAGLVDGEGCIYVTNSARKGPARRSYSIVVEIGMSVKAVSLLRIMRREYGGVIKLSRPATERWSEARAWVVSGVKAEAMLLRILPHLLLKKDQAQVALRVMEIRRSLIPEGGRTARWTDAAADRCEAARLSIQEMNRKGPDPEEPAKPLPGRFVARRVGSQWVTNQATLFSDTGWEPFSGPWPTSGFGGPGGFWTREDSEWPSSAAVSSLSDILETGPIPEKYFLSQTSAKGILRRAERRGRRMPARFSAELTALSETGSSEHSLPKATVDGESALTRPRPDTWQPTLGESAG